MVWKKLNDFVEFWDNPVLGSDDAKPKKRFMALSVEPCKRLGKSGFFGIARQIVVREGSEDVPGYVDRSRLVIVQSSNLLKWKVVKNLKIKGIEKIVEKIVLFEGEEKEFIGLEDSDILIDSDGMKHVYFSISFKYLNKNGFEVYLGHAKGRDFENLEACEPVLSHVSGKVSDFKELCPISSGRFLTEVFVNLVNEKKYSAIGLVSSHGFGGRWKHEKIVHDPHKEEKTWSAGHSSPCRLFNSDFFSYDGFSVGLMNGREPLVMKDGSFVYGKFRPGLFLYNKKKNEIVKVSREPLFEDFVATTITFASDIVYLNDKEAIVYAHPNDSFVRAYKVSSEGLRRFADKMF